MSTDQLPAEARTTAYFVDLVNKWFDACNSRCMKDGLKIDSSDKLEILNEAINIFRDITFSGRRNNWKPIQTGLLISTSSVLCLHSDLVASGYFKFLLSGRLTQDSLENLFSQVRSKGDMHPSPSHFRSCLKLISVAQYLHVPRNMSYVADNSAYIVNFIRKRNNTDRKRESTSVATGSKLSSDDAEQVQLVLSLNDVNALHYISGWICYKMKKKVKDCTQCMDAISNATENKDEMYSQLLNTKTLGLLSVPSNSLFDYICSLENCFSQFSSKRTSSNLLNELMMSSKYVIVAAAFPMCHNVAERSAKCFYKFRLHVFAKFQSDRFSRVVQHGSKSAKQRSSVV